jgi:hypothetical protein
MVLILKKSKKNFLLRFINSTNKDDGIANTIDKGSDNIPINVFLFGDIQETSNYFVNDIRLRFLGYLEAL